MGKRCLFCWRFFVLDQRVGKRQSDRVRSASGGKVCGRDVCKQWRKRLAHRLWYEKNPDYFKDHYVLYGKPWRQKKRPSQEVDKRRDSRAGAYLRLILPIAADWSGLIKAKIDRREIFLLSLGQRDQGGGRDGSGSFQSGSASSSGGGGVECEADFREVGGRAKEAFSVASKGWM